MSIRHTLLIAGFAVASSAAFAQAPPSPATPPAPTAPPSAARPNANCAPTQTTAQGTVAPGGPSSEPLGDKLAKSDGVLCPPGNVDPAMHAPAPNNDANTPVIPPPGSPGGDQSVRPK